MQVKITSNLKESVTEGDHCDLGGGGGCLQCDIMEEHDRFGSEFRPSFPKRASSPSLLRAGHFTFPRQAAGGQRGLLEVSTADIAQAELGLASSACSQWLQLCKSLPVTV